MLHPYNTLQAILKTKKCSKKIIKYFVVDAYPIKYINSAVAYFTLIEIFLIWNCELRQQYQL